MPRSRQNVVTCLRCRKLSWVNYTLAFTPHMCTACAKRSRAPPYEAAVIFLDRLNVRQLNAVMRVCQEWAALVRSGDFFRVISISPDLFCSMPLRIGVLDGDLTRLLSMAPRLQCLQLDELPHITAAALAPLAKCTALKSVVISDCPKLLYAKKKEDDHLVDLLVKALPASLGCLRLSGSSMPRRKDLPLLKQQPYTVGVAECEHAHCREVCIPDLALVCEKCTSGFCKAQKCSGPLGDTYAILCAECDKCAHPITHLRVPLSS